MAGRWAVLAGVALAAACGSEASSDDDDTVGDDDVTVIDASPGNIDAAQPPPDAAPGDVRFVVMGDTGEGNADQAMVAAAIEDVCDAQRCDFVVLLGDNIYDSGVDSTSDTQWQTKFEQPYADLDLPFYAVLGNHDYGGDLFGVETGGLGNEFDKGPIEVMYSDVSDKWTMPATHYTFTYGNVGFIMLDTNSIMWANVDHGDQAAWFPTALMEVSGADWVIAAGHHPVRSNGNHGNAGSYESIEVGGVEVPNPLPILNGGTIETFFDNTVCGTVDIYFAGHDHNRQWLDEPGELCGAELIVSGAGAKVTGFNTPTNAFHFQDDQTEGFMYVVVDGNTLTGSFIDKNGTVDYTRTITR